MIAHLAGTVLRVGAQSLILQTDSGVGYEVQLPPYMHGRLPEAGGAVTLFTTHVLESPNQGATFIPRLVGFASPADRDVYEHLTQVRGLGHRKAMRCLARPPMEVAAMIARGDEAGLKALPEIGSKLAKTLIEQLGSTFRKHLAIESQDASGPASAPAGAGTAGGLTPLAQDAVRALVALGESPAEARRKVDSALQRPGEAPSDAAELVAMALAQ